MKIGFQGSNGSYSQRAANAFAIRHGCSDALLEPLVSSKEVLTKVQAGEVNFGVIALRNSTAGPVQETKDALKGKHFSVVDTISLEIDHAVFIKNSAIELSEIREIRSHEQALMQCRNNLASFFPNAITIPIEDTALGAKRLADNEYANFVAVVCSREFGEQLGLHLVRGSIQDLADNKTEFAFIERRSKSKQVPSNDLMSRFIHHAVTPSTLGWATKGLVIVTILGGELAKEILGYSSIQAAMTIGGFASTVFLLLTSNKVNNFFQYRRIKGYWRYSLSPDDEKPLVAQKHAIPRLVRIDEEDSGLRIRGWLGTRPSEEWFRSTQVLLSPFGGTTGRLVYWYANVHEAPKELLFDGVVSLEWSSDYPSETITKLSGWYIGRLTGDMGVISYQRITEKEFHSIVSE